MTGPHDVEDVHATRRNQLRHDLRQMAAKLTRRPDVKRRPGLALQPRFVELDLDVVCVCDGVDCVLVWHPVLVGTRCLRDRHKPNVLLNVSVMRYITESLGLPPTTTLEDESRRPDGTATWDAERTMASRESVVAASRSAAGAGSIKLTDEIDGLSRQATELLPTQPSLSKHHRGSRT